MAMDQPKEQQKDPGVAMLIEAADTVRQRQKVYGPMQGNMARTAALWTPILGVSVAPWQVAACMITLKIARLVETPEHGDSTVDIAGYAAVLKECQEK
jgi:hypothetical protein|tara:strand:+ start:106 stop:399 length:294 start_codon:yes stop_codon:yes gene_type:complete